MQRRMESCPSTQEVGEEGLPLKTKANKFLITSAFYSSIATSFPALFIRGSHPLDFPFLVNAHVKALPVILCIPCKVQFQLCLALPRSPVSPIFICLCICFLLFSLNIRSLLSQATVLFSSRCQGGWRPQEGQEPVSAMVPVVSNSSWRSNKVLSIQTPWSGCL